MIEDLDLSYRTYSLLKRAGINYIEELEEKTDAELLNIRNIGQVDCREIRSNLENYKKEENMTECCVEDVFKDSKGRWVLRVETYEWDDYNDGFICRYVHIKYCPFCGRKLEK